MPINQLYKTWKRRIQELRPGQRITQIRGFIWLVIGIYLSRSVCLSRIACKMPGEAKLTSATRRLSRLLDNPAIRVREWYGPIAWRRAPETWCKLVKEISWLAFMQPQWDYTPATGQRVEVDGQCTLSPIGLKK